MFNACLICAEDAERSAAINEISLQCNVAFNEIQKGLYSTQLLNVKGENLTLTIASLQHFDSILELNRTSKIHFIGVPGVCIGDKTKVALGDIIIPYRVFCYDTQKTVPGVAEKEGLQEFLRSSDSLYPADNTENVMFSARFFKWNPIVLTQHRPISFEESKIHIDGFATYEEFVKCHQRNLPVPRLVDFWMEHTVRGALGFDTSTFYCYSKIHDSIDCQVLIVKAVAKFAGFAGYKYNEYRRETSFYNYAAAASASYLIQFILNYVTTTKF